MVNWESEKSTVVRSDRSQRFLNLLLAFQLHLSLAEDHTPLRFQNLEQFSDGVSKNKGSVKKVVMKPKVLTKPKVLMKPKVLTIPKVLTKPNSPRNRKVLP